MILSQKLYISSLIVLLGCLNIVSAADKKVRSKVTVSKLQTKGDIYVQVVELNEQMFRISNSEIAQITEFNLQLSSNKQYGVRVFQDINQNQQLDMTESGIPMEPVGFSRNPSLMNGIPPLSKCQFSAGESIKINMYFM